MAMTVKPEVQPAPITPAPRWARPAEAAKHVGIGLSTLYLLAKENPDFPAFNKPSKRMALLDLNQLDAWILRNAANQA